MKGREKIKTSADCPQDILNDQISVSVPYVDFKGAHQIGIVEINKALENDILKVFELLYKEKFPIEKIVPVSEYGWDDEKSCGDNNTSAFNYRVIAGTDRLSNHANGCAIDINPYQNHFIKYEVDKDEKGEVTEIKEIWRFPKTEYDLNEMGTIRPESSLVKLFKELGWTWGGDWKPEEGRVDYQHFEKKL